MKTPRLQSTFAGIGATVAAVSFGYLAVQYFGLYIMFVIGAGIFGLGAAVHRTQQSLPQESLSQTPIVSEFEPKPTKLAAKVKNQPHTSINSSQATVKRYSITSASSTSAARFIRHSAGITKGVSTTKSYGYCRKRLALCHRAKFESSTKSTFIPDNKTE